VGSNPIARSNFFHIFKSLLEVVGGGQWPLSVSVITRSAPDAQATHRSCGARSVRRFSRIGASDSLRGRKDCSFKEGSARHAEKYTLQSSLAAPQPSLIIFIAAEFAGGIPKLCRLAFDGDGLGFGLMIFTVEDIAKLRSGWGGPRPVGELPLHVAGSMGLLVPVVYLSKESLDHINLRHPDVTDFQLILTPFVLRYGLVLRETRRPNVYLCSYVGSHAENRRYGLALKVAEPDREAYLTTFHRVHKRQTNAWLKRCEIIKTLMRNERPLG
jgi:hypothetical protein